MESIVSIGAGRSQLPLIETAIALGLDVITVDQDPHAPGHAAAVAHVRESTHDAEAVVRAVDALADHHSIRGVVTKSSGHPMVTTAAVADALGLPGLRLAAARRAVSKPGQMELCEHAGVPRPRHATCEFVEDLIDVGLKPPLVVKPTLGLVGKRGVSLVRRGDDLVAGFEAARAASEDGLVQVESFVDGSDVVVVGFFAESRFAPVAMIDEETRFEANGRARGHGFTAPARLSGTDVEERLFDFARRIVERNAMGDGIALLTFRVRPGGLAYLIEMHFDLAGDYLTDRFFPAGGFDPIRSSILLSTGWTPGPQRPVLDPTSMHFLFPEDLAKEGERKLDELRGLPGILEAEAFDEEDAGGRAGLVLERRASARDHGQEREIERILGRPHPMAA